MIQTNELAINLIQQSLSIQGEDERSSICAPDGCSCSGECSTMVGWSVGLSARRQVAFSFLSFLHFILRISFLSLFFFLSDFSLYSILVLLSSSIKCLRKKENALLNIKRPTIQWHDWSKNTHKLLSFHSNMFGETIRYWGIPSRGLFKFTLKTTSVGCVIWISSKKNFILNLF